MKTEINEKLFEQIRRLVHEVCEVGAFEHTTSKTCSEYKPSGKPPPPEYASSIHSVYQERTEFCFACLAHEIAMEVGEPCDTSRIGPNDRPYVYVRFIVSFSGIAWSADDTELAQEQLELAAKTTHGWLPKSHDPLSGDVEVELDETSP